MKLTGTERTRRWLQKRYAEIDQMPKIPCACGCGTMIPPINKRQELATYAHNHHPKSDKTQFKPGNKSPWQGKKNPALAESNRTRERTPEEGQKRVATRRARYGDSLVSPEVIARREQQKQERAERKAIERANQPKVKRHMPVEAVAQMTKRVREHPPFLGKRHSPDARRKISERMQREKHPHWRGGTGTLPYGPEFTHKFKELIRERDNYTCQRCGITQDDYGRVLHVHHLDHNKQNNDPTNLVAACNKCNNWASRHRDLPFRLD